MFLLFLSLYQCLPHHLLLHQTVLLFMTQLIWKQGVNTYIPTTIQEPTDVPTTVGTSSVVSALWLCTCLISKLQHYVNPPFTKINF